MPPLRSRRPVIGAVAAVAALAAGAIVVRIGDDSAADSTPTRLTTQPAAASDEARPSPVAQVPAPLGASGDVEMPLDPSASRGDHSERGARQVAVDYLVTVRQRLVYLTPQAGREVLTAWSAPGVAATVLEGEVTEATTIRERLAADGGDVWWVVAPLAIRVDAYTGERARVAVWLTALIASGANPEVSGEATQPMVRFQIDTVELVWSRDRWTVWSTTSVDGPTPMLAPSQPIATAEAFVTSLDGFGLIRRHRS